MKRKPPATSGAACGRRHTDQAGEADFRGKSPEISLQNPRLGGNKLSQFPLIAQGTTTPPTRYCGWISELTENRLTPAIALHNLAFIPPALAGSTPARLPVHRQGPQPGGEPWHRRPKPRSAARPASRPQTRMRCSRPTTTCC